MTVQLPQELVDWIIDCLHEDSATLRSCSLVCRAWLHNSRMRPFLDSEVPSKHQLEWDFMLCPVPEYIERVDIIDYPGDH